ncbi:hypothetical protein NDU88_000420 [Pleurodeles waltl]|uniref:Uncharacterized protein n=1 Tax=Pleurodeles waltl TaxID=8319 RepID=A0AAV7S581_PLEWA|nr:hypothetical protein NDU88_000420 [Pleurodeles waltl]
MSLQFVGPGKPLATKQPVADKGPLTGMPPQGLKYGGVGGARGGEQQHHPDGEFDCCEGCADLTNRALVASLRRVSRLLHAHCRQGSTGPGSQTVHLLHLYLGGAGLAEDRARAQGPMAGADRPGTGAGEETRPRAPQGAVATRSGERDMEEQVMAQRPRNKEGKKFNDIGEKVERKNRMRGSSGENTRTRRQKEWANKKDQSAKMKKKFKRK